MMEAEMFGRTALLMGSAFMERIGSVRVIVIGVGGVGSWCVESLVRSGVRNITIVDSDVVCVSNINRQLMATGQTVGLPKVEVLKRRMQEINPEVRVEALCRVYKKETAESFGLEQYDYIIDAIDTLQDKADLILHATWLTKEDPRKVFFSSMGAALRTDPFAVGKSEFWDVTGDPLARMLRKRFRSMQEFPSRKFLCVCSAELPRENQEIVREVGAVGGGFSKRRPNGTVSHVTIMFGAALAGLVVNDIEKKIKAV